MPLRGPRQMHVSLQLACPNSQDRQCGSAQFTAGLIDSEKLAMAMCGSHKGVHVNFPVMVGICNEEVASDRRENTTLLLGASVEMLV